MATGIKDKVAILGMGCAKFGERWDMEPADLMAEAFSEALQDAGIERDDIQAAITTEVGIVHMKTRRPPADNAYGMLPESQISQILKPQNSPLAPTANNDVEIAITIQINRL